MTVPNRSAARWGLAAFGGLASLFPAAQSASVGIAGFLRRASQWSASTRSRRTAGLSALGTCPRGRRPMRANVGLRPPCRRSMPGRPLSSPTAGACRGGGRGTDSMLARVADLRAASPSPEGQGGRAGQGACATRTCTRHAGRRAEDDRGRQTRRAEGVALSAAGSHRRPRAAFARAADRPAVRVRAGDIPLRPPRCGSFWWRASIRAINSVSN